MLNSLHSASIFDVISRPGHPLPVNVREFFAARFQFRFDAVRIHTDRLAAESAHKLNARAYTVHNHIVFAQPEPELELLAHELAHTIQQSGSPIPEKLRLCEPVSEIEAQACFAAWQVMRGERPCIGPRSEASGLVMRAVDVCPGEPVWSVISAGPQEIYQPANQVIEAAYLLQKADHKDSILLGSQFIYGGNQEIQLPKGAPNKAFGNYLLKELRGIAQQLKPDIVDFKERVFYEIKSARDATMNPVKVRNQLEHYYKLTEAIRKQYGAANEPSWNQPDATWKPPAVMPLPGSVGNRFVCTSATDYSVWPSGLVLYDVRQRKKKDDQKKRKIASFQVVAIDNDATLLLPESGRIRAAMESFAPYYPGFVVIVPTAFWQVWQRQAAEERMRKTTEMMQVKPPPFLDRRTPVGQLRVFGWTMVGLTAGALAAAFWLPILPALLELSVVGAAGTGAAAAGAGAAAAGTGAAVAEAEVISLAAYRAMRASKAAVEIAKAAGVLLVLGLGRKAAASTQVTVSNECAVRVLPIEDFKPFKGTLAASSKYDVPGDYIFTPSDIEHNFDVGKTALYDSVQHTIVAQFVVEYAK